ncbi:MAG: hypothetical protein JWR01_446 [Subtercola sp.]|nr:hypothetical protein [Subtercola sp.]
MSTSPDPSFREEDENESAALVEPVGTGEVPGVTALLLPDVESPTIAAQFTLQAFPFAPDPDYARLVDDLEWGLF